MPVDDHKSDEYHEEVNIKDTGDTIGNISDIYVNAESLSETNNMTNLFFLVVL